MAKMPIFGLLAGESFNLFHAHLQRGRKRPRPQTLQVAPGQMSGVGMEVPMKLDEMGRELHNIHERSEFATFYEKWGITKIEDKIACLKDVLKILASRSDEKDTPEEELMGLEDFVMSHLWEAFE